MYFYLDYRQNQPIKLTKILHEQVHESQVLQSLLRPPMIETSEDSFPAWNWGQCVEHSNCSLANCNDEIIQNLSMKFQEGLSRDVTLSNGAELKLIFEFFESKRIPKFLNNHMVT